MLRTRYLMMMTVLVVTAISADTAGYIESGQQVQISQQQATFATVQATAQISQKALFSDTSQSMAMVVAEEMRGTADAKIPVATFVAVIDQKLFTEHAATNWRYGTMVARIIVMSAAHQSSISV